jgi:flagellar biosynthesis protein FlhF
MHLKRFRRETVKEALRAVREELGPDALVLSTRVVAAPGMKGWFGARVIEVTAAAERPDVSEDRHVAEALAAVRSQAAAAAKTATAGAASRERRSGVPVDRATDEITARLQAAGLEGAIARDVADALPARHRRGASLELIRRTLMNQLAPLSASEDDFAGIEVFVGPPGVGKTTTIAKLAAQERARNGRKLGLMSADGFRVGAVEQLRLYADILGTPLTVARTPDELRSALEGIKRPLLLDTAGRSPSDDVSREMLRVLAGRRGVRTHLVLAASTPVVTARRTLDRFEDARPSRVVITKLDEAESVGPLVSVLKERQLPISFLGTGQRVPEDLERATAPAIASWVAGDAGASASHAGDVGRGTRQGASA